MDTFTAARGGKKKLADREASYNARTSCSCDVISWLVALAAFPFVFSGVVTRRVGEEQSLASHRYCSFISLFSQPSRKQPSKLDIVLHTQKGRAMHELDPGLKQQCHQVCKCI